MIDMILIVKEWRKVLHIREMDKMEDAGADKGVYLPRKILGIKDNAMVDGYGTIAGGGE